MLLDRRFHNRELQMMQLVEHEHIIRLRCFFEKSGRRKDETYLHLVMDYLPETLRGLVLQHNKRRRRFDIGHVRAYLYQTFRALECLSRLRAPAARASRLITPLTMVNVGTSIRAPSATAISRLAEI